MRRLARALTGAMLFLLPAGAGFAADMLPPPIIPYPPAPVEIGSNWYLRGDIGFKVYRPVHAHFDEPTYGDMIDESLSNTGTIGLGAGYRFSRWFRLDATVDYEWPGHFRGRLPCPGPCAAGPYSEEFADISAWTGLVNAYFDLGKFKGITPYVGGGIGFSYVTTSNVRFVNPDNSTGTWGGASKFNLAWALMAGVAIDMSKKWVLDVNYRYLHLGSAQSALIPIGSGTNAIEYDNLAAHEVRVGLRYLVY